MSESKAPAIGYSIVANLGEKRQMTMQYFVDGSETLGVINETIDKTLLILDRQIARYEIGDLRKDLDKLNKTMAQAILDRDNIDAEDDRNTALRNVAMGALNDDYKELHDLEYQKFTNSGRQGSFELKGHAATNAARILSEVKRLQGEAEKAKAEREQAHRNLEASLTNFRANIAVLEAQVAEREALIKGE